MGVWIETMITMMTMFTVRRHTLYGCVDWNLSSWLLVRRGEVTPCMGVWIETE